MTNHSKTQLKEVINTLKVLSEHYQDDITMAEGLLTEAYRIHESIAFRSAPLSKRRQPLNLTKWAA
jgi:hypothetical protein